MNIRVYKFGGASVNGATGFRNVLAILKRSPAGNFLVVISAMGKTTNALEELLKYYMEHDAVSMVEIYHQVHAVHFSVVHELFREKDHPVYNDLESLFDQLRGHIRRRHLGKEGTGPYDFEYDQIVSFGELFSSLILHHFLEYSGLPGRLFDARELIRTDSTFRDARIHWAETRSCIRSRLGRYFRTGKQGKRIAVTQGFIGEDPAGNRTTLGREGSDYSAAIFAHSLDCKEMTIWKDVPGIMNADPKWFRDPRKLDTLSYLEAIELAYYGASVIHPKTIKPLENADIRLYVKCFTDPGARGTVVRKLRNWKVTFPIYIRKTGQVLLSLSPRDFSFILEENLSRIFDILARFHARVSVVQNSAVSFSVCIDADPQALEGLLKEFGNDYIVRYNENLELYTIRHYDQMAIDRVARNRKVLLEQKTRSTVHLVVKETVRQGLRPGSRI
jgi:aspartate kinase